MIQSRTIAFEALNSPDSPMFMIAITTLAMLVVGGFFLGAAFLAKRPRSADRLERKLPTAEHDEWWRAACEQARDSPRPRQVRYFRCPRCEQVSAAAAITVSRSPQILEEPNAFNTGRMEDYDTCPSCRYNPASPKTGGGFSFLGGLGSWGGGRSSRNRPSRGGGSSGRGSSGRW